MSLAPLLKAATRARRADAQGAAFIAKAGQASLPDLAEMIEQEPSAVDWQSRDLDDETILMRRVALYPVDLEGVALLLEKGAAIDRQDVRGRTAVMHCLSAPNQGAPQTEELLRILLRARPDLSIKDQEGKSAFDFARPSLLKILRD